MTAEPDRHEQWVLVVRRSFGVSDDVGAEDARHALVASFEEQLHRSGWQDSPRAIADPMVEALIMLGASGDFDEYLVTANDEENAASTRDAARRLIEQGRTVVDPEHLVLDRSGEYPVEVVVAMERVLNQVALYVREQPFDV
jgi:hypothetical protein